MELSEEKARPVPSAGGENTNSRISSSHTLADRKTSRNIYSTWTSGSFAGGGDLASVSSSFRNAEHPPHTQRTPSTPSSFSFPSPFSLLEPTTPLNALCFTAPLQEATFFSLPYVEEILWCSGWATTHHTSPWRETWEMVVLESSAERRDASVGPSLLFELVRAYGRMGGALPSYASLSSSGVGPRRRESASRGGERVGERDGGVLEASAGGMTGSAPSFSFLPSGVPTDESGGGGPLLPSAATASSTFVCPPLLEEQVKVLQTLGVCPRHLPRSAVLSYKDPYSAAGSGGSSSRGGDPEFYTSGGGSASDALDAAWIPFVEHPLGVSVPPPSHRTTPSRRHPTTSISVSSAPTRSCTPPVVERGASSGRGEGSGPMRWAGSMGGAAAAAVFPFSSRYPGVGGGAAETGGMLPTTGGVGGGVPPHFPLCPLLPPLLQLYFPDPYSFQECRLLRMYHPVRSRSGAGGGGGGGGMRRPVANERRRGAVLPPPPPPSCRRGGVPEEKTNAASLLLRDRLEVERFYSREYYWNSVALAAKGLSIRLQQRHRLAVASAPPHLVLGGGGGGGPAAPRRRSDENGSDGAAVGSIPSPRAGVLLPRGLPFPTKMLRRGIESRSGSTAGYESGGGGGGGGSSGKGGGGPVRSASADGGGRIAAADGAGGGDGAAFFSSSSVAPPPLPATTEVELTTAFGMNLLHHTQPMVRQTLPTIRPSIPSTLLRLKVGLARGLGLGMPPMDVPQDDLCLGRTRYTCVMATPRWRETMDLHPDPHHQKSTTKKKKKKEKEDEDETFSVQEGSRTGGGRKGKGVPPRGRRLPHGHFGAPAEGEGSAGHPLATRSSSSFSPPSSSSSSHPIRKPLHRTSHRRHVGKKKGVDIESEEDIDDPYEDAEEEEEEDVDERGKLLCETLLHLLHGKSDTDDDHSGASVSARMRYPRRGKIATQERPPPPPFSSSSFLSMGVAPDPTTTTTTTTRRASFLGHHPRPPPPPLPPSEKARGRGSVGVAHAGGAGEGPYGGPHAPKRHGAPSSASISCGDGGGRPSTSLPAFLLHHPALPRLFHNEGEERGGGGGGGVAGKGTTASTTTIKSSNSSTMRPSGGGARHRMPPILSSALLDDFRRSATAAGPHASPRRHDGTSCSVLSLSSSSSSAWKRTSSTVAAGWSGGGGRWRHSVSPPPPPPLSPLRGGEESRMTTIYPSERKAEEMERLRELRLRLLAAYDADDPILDASPSPLVYTTALFYVPHEMEGSASASLRQAAILEWFEDVVQFARQQEWSVGQTRALLLIAQSMVECVEGCDAALRRRRREAKAAPPPPPHLPPPLRTGDDDDEEEAEAERTAREEDEAMEQAVSSLLQRLVRQAVFPSTVQVVGRTITPVSTVHTIPDPEAMEALEQKWKLKEGKTLNRKQQQQMKEQLDAVPRRTTTTMEEKITTWETPLDFPPCWSLEEMMRVMSFLTTSVLGHWRLWCVVLHADPADLPPEEVLDLPVPLDSTQRAFIPPLKSFFPASFYTQQEERRTIWREVEREKEMLFRTGFLPPLQEMAKKVKAQMEEWRMDWVEKERENDALKLSGAEYERVHHAFVLRLAKRMAYNAEVGRKAGEIRFAEEMQAISEVMKEEAEAAEAAAAAALREEAAAQQRGGKKGRTSRGPSVVGFAGAAAAAAAKKSGKEKGSTSMKPTPTTAAGKRKEAGSGRGSSRGGKAAEPFGGFRGHASQNGGVGTENGFFEYDAVFDWASVDERLDAILTVLQRREEIRKEQEQQGLSGGKKRRGSQTRRSSSGRK